MGGKAVKATDQYKKHRAEVDKQLRTLRENLRKHAAKQAKFEENWAYAGDMGHLADLLRTANNFIK